MTGQSLPPNEAGGLRARAARCRAFANEYATDVGASLNELAVELDLKADRLDAKDEQARAKAEQSINTAPRQEIG